MNRRSFIFFLSLPLAAAIFYLNDLAIKYEWFWRYRWFDLPLHFLGGLLIGLLVFSLFATPTKSWFGFVFTAALAALIVGGAWELFEYWADWAYDLGPYFQPDGLDTLGDLIADLIGGTTAGFFTFYLWRRWLN